MRKHSKEAIKYLAHFNMPSSMENRYMAPSACTKIDYIAHSIVSAGKSVEIISASISLDKTYKASVKKLDEGIDVFFLHAFKRSKNAMVNKVSTFCYYLSLMVHLLLNIEASDILMVYHSAALIPIVSLVKKLKKCKLILEVEESYGVASNNSRLEKREFKYFKCADAYLFPTEILNHKVNIENKPFIICHGTYQVEPVLNDLFRIEDHIIHCVYAGTFDRLKGGVYAAIEAASLLPKGYCLHILGFGSDYEIEEVQTKISYFDSVSDSKISYEGCLTGEAYIRFLQRCDIGLSTQNPNAAYNDTSFPSKILSYMANGLRVVTVKIPVVETSSVGRYLSYYEKQTPQDIANAILSVNVGDKYNSRKIVHELDESFVSELSKFLCEVK